MQWGTSFLDAYLDSLTGTNLESGKLAYNLLTLNDNLIRNNIGKWSDCLFFCLSCTNFVAAMTFILI